MDCQQCGKKVSFLRVLADRKYCSDEHRGAHMEHLNRLGVALLRDHAPAAAAAAKSGLADMNVSEESARRLGTPIAQSPGII